MVVLHDVVDAALDRLDEFLTAVEQRGAAWSQTSPTSARRSATGRRRRRSTPCARRTDHLRSPPWSCTTPRSGSRSPTRSRRDRRRARRHRHGRGRSTTSVPRGWPRRTPRPGSVTTARSGCTCTTATSTSRRSTGHSRSAGCRSTSTTDTSTTSCGTCSTTPMPRRWCSTRRSAIGSPGRRAPAEAASC